jgi:membrane protein
MRILYFRAPLAWRELIWRTIVDTRDDGVAGLAAQLAFYFFLALFPALLLLVSLLALLPVDAQLALIIQRVSAVAPGEMLAIVRDQIERVRDGPPGGLLTLAVAGAVWSSSSAMTAIIGTVNQAYDIDEGRPWWKMRLLAIGLTLVLALFIVSAFTLVVGGVDLAVWVARTLGAGDLFTRLWSMVQWPVALFLVVLAIDLVYFVAPNADAEWTWLTPGGVLATALWLLASLGFKVYVSRFADFGAVYGSIGGVIVLLLWFYLSAFALLVGAELNAEIDRAMRDRGSARREGSRRARIDAAAEAAAEEAGASTRIAHESQSGGAG